MQKNEITTWLEKFIAENFGIPKEVAENNHTQPLVGSTFGLDAIDLVYIFLELKRKFEFEALPEALTKGSFLTIDNISELVSELNNCVDK